MAMEKQKNLLEPTDIKWKFIKSLGLDTYHHAIFKCNEYGLQMEHITNRSLKTGQFGKPKIYYFIDNCEKEMTDIQDLCDTWNELNNFDDPNNEIVWVKKIVPKIEITRLKRT